MPLSIDDCRNLLNFVQGDIRRRDPALFERISGRLERSRDPRSELLAYLNSVAELTALRSSGTYGAILDSMNEMIRTSDFRGVRSVRVDLHPADQEIYQRDYIPLASLPDREVPLAALSALVNDLESEIDWDEPPSNDNV